MLQVYFAEAIHQSAFFYFVFDRMLFLDISID